MASGLSLPGTLSVTQAALAGVGSSLDVDIRYAVAALERTKADGSASFTNFIQANADLNALVSYTASASGKTEDDAYALAALTVESASASGVVLSLPSAAGVLVDAGEIDAQTPEGVSLGKFPVTLTVSCNDQGVMSSSIAISGADVQPGAELTDDAHKAQKVYWQGAQSVPAVAADDADVLSTKLTSAQLTTFYSSELSTINAQYNGQNMIASWTIALNAMASAVDNVLSQHARFLGKRALGSAIFAADDKIVCATPFSYGVAFEDYLGASQTIVANANVFGVLNHTA